MMITHELSSRRSVGSWIAAVGKAAVSVESRAAVGATQRIWARGNVAVTHAHIIHLRDWLVCRVRLNSDFVRQPRAEKRAPYTLRYALKAEVW